MLGLPVPYTYQDHRAELGPGSSLVLYTDGLVERRADGIDPGIERLARSMAAFDTTELEQDLDATADNVLKQLLHDSERDDDVCLLMCHASEFAEPDVEGNAVLLPSQRLSSGAFSRGSVDAIGREGVCRESF
jgi:hypothetical protein